MNIEHMYIVLHGRNGENILYATRNEINIAHVTIGENTMYVTQWNRKSQIGNS